MGESSLKEFLLPRVVVLDLAHQLILLEKVLESSRTFISIDPVTLLQQVMEAIAFKQRALLELDYLIFEIFTNGFSCSIPTETEEVRKMATVVGRNLYSKLENHKLYIEGYTPYCVDKVVGTKLVLLLNDVWVDFYGKVFAARH